jgi:DinB superfamily
MNPAVAMLLDNLASSRRLMLDSVRDLSAAELSRPPSPALRSCVWLLGMAAVADQEVLRLLEVVELPELPAGFEARFARWGTGQDGDTLRYDSSLPEIFASQRDALIRATAALDAAALDEPVDPPDHLDEEALFEFGTVGEMVLAASAYTSFLVGEVSAVRLALGKAPIEDPLGLSLAKN